MDAGAASRAAKEEKEAGNADGEADGEDADEEPKDGEPADDKKEDESGFSAGKQASGTYLPTRGYNATRDHIAMRVALSETVAVWCMYACIPAPAGLCCSDTSRSFLARACRFLKGVN